MRQEFADFGTVFGHEGWRLIKVDHLHRADEAGLARRRRQAKLGGMQHSPGFLKIVNDAKSRVREVNVDQAKARLAANPRAVLIDVREDTEWAAAHAKGATHLGKGVLERDLETRFPDPATELILYCGGGFRSALAADMAQKMGYQNVYSLDGGFRAITAAGWTIET